MGNINTVPVLSQTKSFVQWCSRDDEGALATQVDFSRGCIVVSQLRSACEAIWVSDAAAQDTQCEFLKCVEALLDGVPVVGHAKGVVHYAMQQSDKGDRCMKSASRTTAVVGAAIAVAATGGAAAPAAAFAVAGGLLADGATSGIDSAIHKEFRPSGLLAAGTAIHNARVAGQAMSGDIFDVIATVASDAVTGVGAHAAYRSIAAKISTRGRIAEALQQVSEENRSIAKSNLTICVEEAMATPEIVDNPVYSRCQGDGGCQGSGYNVGTESRLNAAEFKASVDARTPSRFESMTKAMKSRSIDDLSASRLQKSNPGAQLRAVHSSGKLYGEFSNCAEHVAAEPVMRANQNIITTSTVQKLQGGQVVGKARCANCVQFNLGVVPTDMLGGVHLNPTVSAISYAAGVGILHNMTCNDGESFTATPEAVKSF